MAVTTDRTDRSSGPRPEKVAVVDEVRERLSAAGAAILSEYRGLKVHELAALRTSLRAAGGDYRIYKNTLVRLAARELDLGDLEPFLTGPTAITFVQGDAVLVAKALRDFAKTHPALSVKGGLLGTSVLGATEAASLADVAPRDVLLAQLAGALAAPLRQMAGLLAAIPRNLAYGLKALIDKQGGPPEEPAGPAEATEADEAAPPAEAPAEASEADEAAPPTEAPAEAAPPAEAPAEATEAAGETTETDTNPLSPEGAM